ncbi:AI-2E family transporter [Ferrimonas sediminicola]|uniref:AI-2E family transporter n=1 Tax=Ferrimonas sediminicola TaxID=2569538 RepID=A0A4U1B9L1_9GAMM|nr:AI-2E family transporter [Ferrimonas sediminicola]TKB47334.1 AI-2E family transporter [Ferrimonas sediminicola]
MNQPTQQNHQLLTAAAVEAAVKIGAMVILLSWCFQILRPFLVLILWGGIIAVALFPVTRGLSERSGLKLSLVSTLVTLVVLVLLLVPTLLFSGALFQETQSLLGEVKAGTLVISPPPESVAQWPLVGEDLYALWQRFSSNLEAALESYGSQIREGLSLLASTLGGVGLGLLQFVVSVIIAGVFMSNAEPARRLFHAVALRLAGPQGEEFTALSVATIRSVTQGVIGVALIQSLLSGVGMGLAGVPGTGLWMLLVLIVAIVQLPPLLVLAPVMIYLFSVQTTTVAVVFLVWGLLVSASDAVLKPMLMGRGVDIPMLVILMGAIGGMLLSGIVGLFVGAVVLALGFKLFIAWMESEGQPRPQASQGQARNRP